jgi:hypothetical protein
LTYPVYGWSVPAKASGAFFVIILFQTFDLKQKKYKIQKEGINTD